MSSTYTIQDTTRIPSWAPSTLYFAGDDVIQNNALYRRIAGGTSGLTFNATEEALWNVISATGTITSWVTGTYYEVGEVVTNNNTIYRRSTAGTAGATFDNPEQGNWTVISNYTTISAFVGNVAVPAGKLVSTGTRIVRRNSNGTSGATFSGDETNWSLVKARDIAAWIANTFYYQSEQVIFGGSLYQRVANGTSGATFDATEATNWLLIQNYQDIPAWTASTYYPAGKLVTQGTRVIKHTASSVSTATFDATEAALWTVIKPITVATWTASTYYYAGEQVTHAVTGDIITKIASGASTATFDGTEAALWTKTTNGPVTTFTASTYYFLGDQVTTGTRIVRRTTAGISAATFTTAEAANWSLVDQIDIAPWQASTYYFIGELVTHAVSGDVLKKIASGVTTATFDASEATLWTLVSTSASLSTWAASTYYFANDIIKQNGVIYRRIAAAVSLGSFSATEEALWTRIGFTQNGAVKTITSTTYTVLQDDGVLILDPSANAINVTLPSALPDGKFFPIQYVKHATNAITFTAGAGTTIVDPSTYLAGASFNAPGTTGQYGTTNFFKLNNVWNFTG